MKETLLWPLNAGDEGYLRGNVCWLDGFGWRRRAQYALFDGVAIGQRRIRAIHSRISALSHPIFLPRNCCFRGNCPTAAMVLKIHGGRRTSLATSWAVRMRSHSG